MKRYLIVILALILTACTPNPKQNNNTQKSSENREMKSLKDALSIYTKATIDNDIDTLVTFIYPKVFKLAPKDKMVKSLKKVFNSGKMAKINDVKHKNIDPIKKYDKGIYSIITSSMTTVIKSPRPDDSKFEEYMLKTLKTELSSKGVVTLDSENHIFKIKHTSKTIALNEDGSWKFIGFKQAKKYIENDIFPKELINRLELKDL